MLTGWTVPASEKAWTFSMEAQQKPPNSLPLTRFLLVLQQAESPSILEQASINIFNAIFAKGDTALFTSVANNEIDKLHSVLNISQLNQEKIKEYLEKANSKEVKELVKNEAKRYVEEWNVYGVPWMNIKRGKDGQVKHFMGSDRFELIAAW